MVNPQVRPLDSIWAANGEESSGAPQSAAPAGARRFNWRLLIITAIIAAPVVIGARFWRDYQVDRHAKVFLDKATAAEEAQDWKEAITWYRKYLRFRPEDVKRIQNLATVMEKTANDPKDLLRIAQLLSRCLDEDRNQTDIRLRMAGLLVFLDPERSLREADIVLKAEPRSLEGLRVRATALQELSQGRRGGHDVWFLQLEANEKLLRRERTNVLAAEQLAAIYQRQAERLSLRWKRPEKEIRQMGDRVMDDLVINCQGDTPSRLARCGYRRVYSQNRQGFSLDNDLRIVLQREPNHPTALHAAALHFIDLASRSQVVDTARLELAREHLDRAVKVTKDDFRPFLGLSLVHSQLQEPKKALAALEKGLAVVPANPQLLLRQTELQMESGDFPAVEAGLRQLRKGIKSQIANAGRTPLVRRQAELWLNHSRIIEARWLLAENNPKANKSQARDIIAQVEPKAIVGEDAQVILNWLGFCCINLEDWDRALTAFRIAVVASPNSIRPRLRLARLYRARQRFREAILEYERLLQGKLPTEFDVIARTELTRLLAEQQKSKLRGDRNWDKCDRVLTALNEVGGTRPGVILLNLEIQIAKAPPAGRIKILEATRKLEATFAESPRFWRGVADIYWKLGQPGDAQRATVRLERMAKLNGQAENKAMASKIDQAIMRANTAAGQGNIDEALKLLQPLAGEKNLVAWLTRLEWAVQRSRLDELGKMLAQIPAKNHDSPLAQLLTAYQLILAADPTAAQLEQAKSILNKVRVQRPDAAPVRLALARLAERQDQIVATLSHYRAVHDAGNRSLWLSHRITGLLLILGRNIEAWDYLQGMDRDEWYHPDLLPMVVKAAVLSGNAETGVRLAQQAIKEDPNQPEHHVALGHALLAAGDENQEAAQAAFAKAIQVAPSHPGMWVALLAFDAQSGKDSFELYRNSARLVQLLKSHSPKLTDGWKWYILGRANDLANNVSGAERLFRRAVQADPGLKSWLPRGTLLTKRAVPAPPTFASLAAVDSTAPTLGLVMMGFGLSKEAKPLFRNQPRIEAVGRFVAEGEAVNDLVVQVLGADRRRASVGDHLLLAHIARLQGNKELEKRHYEQMLTKTRRAADLVSYAAYALRERSVSHAQTALELLTQQARNSTRYQALRLRLSALVYHDRAVNLAATRERELKGTERLLFLRFLALAEAREGRLKTAVALVDRYFRLADHQSMMMQCLAYAKESAPVIALTDKLIQQKRVGSALSFLISWAIRHNNSEEEEVKKRIESWLAALNKDNEPIPPQILSAVAAWHEFQGDGMAALAATQTALKADPYDLIHRSNLAWGLAVYKEQPEKALAKVDEMIQLAGPQPQLLDTKGVILYQLDRDKEAESSLRAAWDGKPDSTVLHLAAVALRAEKPDLAGRLFSEYRRAKTPINSFDRQLVDRLRQQLGTHAVKGPPLKEK